MEGEGWLEWLGICQSLVVGGVGGHQPPYIPDLLQHLVVASRRAEALVLLIPDFHYSDAVIASEISGYFLEGITPIWREARPEHGHP